MLRRKMWAAATLLACLGSVQAQTNGSPKATLGAPVAEPAYKARGQSPEPVYPAYIPPYGSQGITYTQPVKQSSFAVGQLGTPEAVMPGTAPGTLPPAPITNFPMGPNGAPMGTNPIMSMPMQMPMPTTMPTTSSISTSDYMGNPTMMMPTTSGVQMVAPNSYPPIGNPVMSYMDTYPMSINGSCQTTVAGTTCPTVQCPCGPMPCVWIAPEFLLWRPKGMNTPALVTAAPQGDLGTLADPTSRVIYGNQNILDDYRAGFRVRGGMWFDKEGSAGLDLGFMMLHQNRGSFIAQSDGNPGLFRPFFNASTIDANGNPLVPGEDAQLVSFIDPTFGPVISGRVTVSSLSDVIGGEANFRKVMVCNQNLRLDLLMGYRYMRLRDVLSVREDLIATSRDPDVEAALAPFGSRITVFDRFETINQFHGANIGIAGEYRWGRLTLGARMSIALGVNVQQTNIEGSTNIATPDGQVVNSQGGLLALPTNIGTYTRERFSIMPEVGVTLGYDISKNFRVFGGYNFLYWTRVARAGEQIDTTINSSYIPFPNGTVPQGVARPTFQNRESDYYLHGWTFGIEFRW